MGHPPGLATLFFLEMWERFSYNGMRAILVLFAVALPAQGGLGLDTQHAASLYGTYTMAVYLASVPGGFIADGWLGARLAVLLGGIVIVAGQFCLVVTSPSFFYLGLAFIVVGTGLLKPNISTMVGMLYSANGPRRDSGFSLFYMGINVGAVRAPLVCGYLAESAAFQGWLAANGFDPLTSWHWGFGAAGVGLIAGLMVFVLRRSTLASAGSRPRRGSAGASVHAAGPLTAQEWRRITAISALFVFTILFWSAYEQKGASLNLFAKRLVTTSVGGFEFPASWLQSLTPFYVILLAPVSARLWIRLGDRQPSSPAKFALGLASMGIAFCILVPASALTATGRISPVGLSAVTRVAPARFVGLMMGAWFFRHQPWQQAGRLLLDILRRRRPRSFDAFVRRHGGDATYRRRAARVRGTRIAPLDGEQGMTTRRNFLMSALIAPLPSMSYSRAWPTIARRRNGQLLIACSGGREAHVCPFGRVELLRSSDEGRTWSWPQIVMDSPIDDRDAGVLETHKGSLLVTTFTSLAYERTLGQAKDWDAERLERWQSVQRATTAEQRKSLLGSWMLRSTDGGLTWSAPYRVPVNSPHGPITLSDGRLLYPGKEMASDDRHAIGVCESLDDGVTWRWLAGIPTRRGDDALNYHELHGVETSERGHVVVHIRNHNKENDRETLQSESFDGGKTWSEPRAIGVWGLPSHLLRLRDGRLVMTYGYRRPPRGNLARVSRDRGHTWSEAVTLSDDGTGDLGYPSTVELASGELLSLWYEARPVKLELRLKRWSSK